MNEFQIQLKPGKLNHFKTAVRSFDKTAIITSISNSSINFNLKTVMEPVDVSCLTSVKIATQINKEEFKPNSVSSTNEEVIKVNMDPLGYVTSTPASYFTTPTSTDINGNPTKSFFTVVEDSEPKEIKRKSNNFSLDLKNHIDTKATLMEADISACIDRDKKLELLQDYVNFLKYTKLLF